MYLLQGEVSKLRQQLTEVWAEVTHGFVLGLISLNHFSLKAESIAVRGVPISSPALSGRPRAMSHVSLGASVETSRHQEVPCLNLFEATGSI